MVDGEVKSTMDGRDMHKKSRYAKVAATEWYKATGFFVFDKKWDIMYTKFEK